MGDPPFDEALQARMLEALREFFARDQDSHRPSAAALRLATAILFLQVIRADHKLRQDEHDALRHALDRAFGIRGDEAAVIVRLAEEQVGSRPLPDLLSVLCASCDLVERRRIVENLWRLAFADAELAGHEEYLVRKVAEWLGLSTADLMETKVRAREAFLSDL